jgi:hypothetical protein
MPTGNANAGAAGDSAESAIFQATAAHAYIIGASIFGIFWGVVNVIMIRGIQLDAGVVNNVLGNENKSE